MTSGIDQAFRRRVHLPGRADAAGQARALTTMLAPSLAPPDRDVLQLLAGELVANAVTHGGAGPDDRIVLELVASDETVRVSVTDAGPGFGVTGLSPARDGRSGLYLLDALATRWGMVREAGRTRVWFELEVRDRLAAGV